MRPILHVMMGIPASGKSTGLTNGALISVVISPDEIRKQLTGDMSNQDVNGQVFEMAHNLVKSSLTAGKTVVFDATNVQARSRRELIKIARACDATTHLDVRDVPLAVAKERNAQRERVVPEHVLDRMYRQFVQSLSEIGHEDWDVIVFHRFDKAN